MKKTNVLALIAFVALLTACSEKRYTPGFGGFDGMGAGFGDTYSEIEENPFVEAAITPVSTFSIDADGASYSNVRRMFAEGTGIVKDAVRSEEFVNYFDLGYASPQNGEPVAVNGEVSTCPWKAGNKLVRIGLRGKDIPAAELPASNFVFLIDVSGSMASSDKLFLLKEGFKMFADALRDQDRVSIVTYAGNADVLLESTPGNEKAKIKQAIDKLGAGGGTAGAKGILTAYQIAKQNFKEGGNNRVVLGTDGDFNVGISTQEELIKLIETERESGVYLTVLGVGRGGLNEAMMEQLADKGNGNYEYLDKTEQLKKVFIYEFSKFFTVAKDVKVQVAFNPQNVKAYRLIGYENRLLATDDFADDKKDAGEIGAGQSITALYEIVPQNNPDYRLTQTFEINFRYKKPDASASQELNLKIFDEGRNFEDASAQMRFAGGTAAFAMLLRKSKHAGDATYESALGWVAAAGIPDPHGLKNELEGLIRKSK